jgi:uncharacterized MnhB-related membrane protein
MDNQMIFIMVFWAMFYLAFILLLPRSIYLIWKKRRITGLIAMAIFLAPIIFTYIALPELDICFLEEAE